MKRVEFETPAGRLKIGADRILLEWGGVELPMRLVFNGLRVTNSDGQTIAMAPSIALSFEPRSVFKARFLPTAIVIERPTLDADISREGGMLHRIFANTDSSSQGEVVDLLIEQLLAEPNYTTLLGQLDTVLVEHGHVSLRDVPSGVIWIAPDVRAELKRDDSGVIISAAGSFSNGGKVAKFGFADDEFWFFVGRLEMVGSDVDACKAPCWTRHSLKRDAFYEPRLWVVRIGPEGPHL